jgi:hypothetical protein
MAMMGDQFANTRMCKFFPVGKCTKGVQCPFAHDVLDLREQPDLRKTKLCKTMLKTGECKDENCSYAHSKSELRTTPALAPKTKTKFCRNLKFGVCSHGSKCNFAHSPAELNLPMPSMDAVLQLPPGLDWEAIFGDGDEETAYVSSGNTDSGDDKSDQDSTPTLSTELAEPAYVHIGSAMDPSMDAFAGIDPLAMDAFAGLPMKDAAEFYSLGDFTGIDPALALTDFTGDWGMDPMAAYMNSPEFWQADLMSAYAEQAQCWDWQGFEQQAVIDCSID